MDNHRLKIVIGCSSFAVLFIVFIIYSYYDSQIWPVEWNSLQMDLLQKSDNLSISNNDLTPIALWLENVNRSYVPYMDMKFAKDCGVPSRREELFTVMKDWISFTAVHNIPWWLTFGSLIGSIRHQDMVPWDSDIDIAIPTQFEPIIRNFSTPRAEISNKKMNIVVRPGNHCPENGARLDCTGNTVYSHVDGCAFCGPLGRVFYSSETRMDIYLYDFKFASPSGNLVVEDEGFFEYMTKPPIVPVNWILPLKNCSFMGFTLQCPRQSEMYIINYYKTFKSLYKCFRGEWLKV